nr:hypothetical protein [Tanacetum cinerariifolium]
MGLLDFVNFADPFKKARGWVVGHGFYFVVHKCACFVECRSALGKVISMAINKGIQQGLEAEVVHGKAGRSLTQTEAYDLEIEGMYVATVSEFEGRATFNETSTLVYNKMETVPDHPSPRLLHKRRPRNKCHHFLPLTNINIQLILNGMVNKPDGLQRRKDDPILSLSYSRTSFSVRSLLTNLYLERIRKINKVK